MIKYFFLAVSLLFSIAGFSYMAQFKTVGFGGTNVHLTDLDDTITIWGFKEIVAKQFNVSLQKLRIAGAADDSTLASKLFGKGIPPLVILESDTPSTYIQRPPVAPRTHSFLSANRVGKNAIDVNFSGGNQGENADYYSMKINSATISHFKKALRDNFNVYEDKIMIINNGRVINDDSTFAQAISSGDIKVIFLP